MDMGSLQALHIQFNIIHKFGLIGWLFLSDGPFYR